MRYPKWQSASKLKSRRCFVLLKAMTEAGWYHAHGDPPGTVRPWNGTAWVGEPIQAPASEPAQAVSQQFEPGWHYAQGDPAGTMRRWNGTTWVGQPIAAPKAEPTTNKIIRQHRTTELTKQGAQYGVATLGALATLATLFAILSFQFFSGAAAARGNASVLGGNNPIGLVPGLNVLGPLTAFGVLLTAIVFLPWLKESAVAANISQFTHGNNQFAHHRRRPRGRSSWALTIVIFFVFGPIPIALYAINTFMSSVVKTSGVNGLFTIVFDTAMAASIDPETGISQISPIKIIIWWALWWLPVPLTVLVWLWIIIVNTTNNIMATALQLTGGLLALQVISLGCLAFVVGQIMSHLSQ